MAATYPVFGKRTPADLLKYSHEHVSYEFEMLKEVSELPRLPEGEAGQEWAKRQVIVEGFVLHVRNVLAFLLSSHDEHEAKVGALRFKKAGDCDFAAEEFCPAGWRSRVLNALGAAAVAFLEDAKSRANREIAHLTCERIDGFPAAKEWSPGAVRLHLRGALALLRAEADSTKMAARALAAIDSLLGPMGPSWALGLDTSGQGVTGPAKR